MTTRISLFFTEENNFVAEWIKSQVTKGSLNNFIIEILKEKIPPDYEKKSSIPKEVSLDSTETRSESISKETS